MINEKNIKISIIVPVYNASKYLSECLDSIAKQTLKDIEIICINDGSTDNSLQILNDYFAKDKRFVIINQENQGVSVARNTGIESAKGDYIAFVDSDDYIKSDFLEILYSKAVKNNAEISAADIVYVANGKLKYDNYMSKQTFKANKSLLTSYKDKSKFVRSVNVWNKLYRTDFINKYNLKFMRGCKFGEDTCFIFLAVSLAQKISLTRDTAYYYRKNDESVTKNAFNSSLVFDLVNTMDYIQKLLIQKIDEGVLSKEYLMLFYAYEINQFHTWYKETAEPYKTEFKNKAVERLKSVVVESNKYISLKTKTRYEKFMGIYEPFWKKLAIFK